MPPIVLKWEGESDGDSNHKPTGLGYRLAGQEQLQLYLQKLGQQYMVASGRAEKGKTYIFDQLPDGYTLWEKTRANNPKHTDRWLYGNPKHMVFNSPNEFSPHYKYLCDGKEGTCGCVRCGKHEKSTSKRSTRPTTSAGKPLSMHPRPGRPLSKGPVDEDGVPYTVTIFLSLLAKEGSLERPVEEKLSMDWTVEHRINKETRERLSEQYTFVPRVGEIVLWCRSIAGELRLEPGTGQLKVWNGKEYTGHPTWLGGVVTEAPVIDEPVRLDDITHETKKKYAVNRSGFRVECYPDPGKEDKAYSKQYTYVPMHHIRPMAFFLDVLKGIPKIEWHPTLFNVMKAMTSVSCIDRFKLIGEWPNFHLYHRGLFFGAESYWEKDPIRLNPPEGRNVVTEVMVPTKFAVRTYGVKPDADGIVTGHTADRVELCVQGQIYTTNVECSVKGEPARLPKDSILYPYGPWYYFEGSNDKHETQYQNILGRLFEYEAMKRWYPGIKPSVALNAGFGSVTVLRRHRVKEVVQEGGHPSGHFWGEHRAEALDLATFNGKDVGIHDVNRDPKRWRRILSIVNEETSIHEGPELEHVAPKAGLDGITPPQPLEGIKDTLFVGLDSDSDKEVEETIDGVGKGKGLEKTKEMEVAISGEPSSKRARML